MIVPFIFCLPQPAISANLNGQDFHCTPFKKDDLWDWWGYPWLEDLGGLNGAFGEACPIWFTSNIGLWSSPYITTGGLVRMGPPWELMMA